MFFVSFGHSLPTIEYHQPWLSRVEAYRSETNTADVNVEFLLQILQAWQTSGGSYCDKRLNHLMSEAKAQLTVSSSCLRGESWCKLESPFPLCSLDLIRRFYGRFNFEVWTDCGRNKLSLPIEFHCKWVFREKPEMFLQDLKPIDWRLWRLLSLKTRKLRCACCPEAQGRIWQNY